MSVVSSSFRSRVRANIEGPVAGVFGRLGLTPNALTLIGFGIAVVGAILAAAQMWLVAGLVVAFGAVFDLFDGALARATNKVSKFGAFLDSTFDRAGEAVVYVGIAVGAISANFAAGAVLASFALAASFMVSYTRAKSESLGFSSGNGMANVGLGPREVRIAILATGLVILGLVGPVGPWGIDCPQNELVLCLPTDFYHVGDLVLGATLGLIAIVATLTTIQRILFVYRQSKSTNQEANR